MGLILSVLVVCVGVYKFIQRYGDTGRKISYEKNVLRHNVSKNSENTEVYPRVKLCRDFLSHEDVEIECTSSVLSQDSSGGLSKRYLVTEKDEESSRTPSPRRFLITKEDDNDPNLREFLIAKGKPKGQPNTKRFVLVDTKEGFRDVSPLPLPKKFVITQDSRMINQETIHSFKQGIGVGFNSLKYKGRNVDDLSVLKDETVATTATRNHSTEFTNGNLPQDEQISSSVLQIYNNTPEEFHRDRSPYPNLNVTVRKGSISMEMLDTTKVSMVEYDEDQDSASNKIDIITKTDNNTTEYTSNQVLVMPPRDDNKGLGVVSKEARSKSASRPDVPASEAMRRVNSSSKMYDKDLEDPSSLFVNVLNKGEDEEFRNSLDGIKRGNEARRSFRKKKNRSQNSLGN